MNGGSALLLVFCAGLLPTSIAAATEPPAPPPAEVSDEQSYRDAMQCKVRVEALAAMPVTRDRERILTALRFWSEQERKAGTKLGKSEGEMMGDEVLFGFAEFDASEGYRLANLCVSAASSRR